MTDGGVEDRCTCGCDKTRREVVRELIGKGLNEDQADAAFSDGNRIRREQQ